MPKLRRTRLLFAAPLLAATLHAQTHRVEKPENVTRAVSVYEWTGDITKPTAARLIPVSIFIDKEFKDGGTYYARPVPLTLYNGNIYSLEKAGLPQATLTVDYARHLQTAVAGRDDTIDLGWFGYGTYSALPVARAPRALRASSAPPQIVSSKDKDDDRPTFANRGKDTSKSDSKSSKKAPDASVTPVPDTPNDDPDRPKFSKVPPPKGTDPASSTPPSTTPDPATPAPTSTPDSTKPTRTDTRTQDPTDDTDRPTLRHRDPKQADADRKSKSRSTVIGTGDLNDDPNRPNMRRGATAGIGGAPSPQLTGLPAGLHQVVAVSDPTDREPHPFTREWSTQTEQAEILSKLEAIAQQQLAAYNRTNGAEVPPPAPAKPATTAAARNRRPAPPAHTAPAILPLTGEQLNSYTLSYGGLPTFVYTAISDSSVLPPAGPKATSAPHPVATLSTPERYVTLVAQQLPSGELQLAFSSVTDAAHLDRTPWFRLVDAVDPDAEHRASLLFELRGHTSRQFALYRILSARADQIFVTHPAD